MMGMGERFFGWACSNPELAVTQRIRGVWVLGVLFMIDGGQFGTKNSAEVCNR